MLLRPCATDGPRAEAEATLLRFSSASSRTGRPPERVKTLRSFSFTQLIGKFPLDPLPPMGTSASKSALRIFFIPLIPYGITCSSCEQAPGWRPCPLVLLPVRPCRAPTHCNAEAEAFFLLSMLLSPFSVSFLSLRLRLDGARATLASAAEAPACAPSRLSTDSFCFFVCPHRIRTFCAEKGIDLEIHVVLYFKYVSLRAGVWKILSVF